MFGEAEERRIKEEEAEQERRRLEELERQQREERERELIAQEEAAALAKVRESGERGKWKARQVESGAELTRVDGWARRGRGRRTDRLIRPCYAVLSSED